MHLPRKSLFPDASSADMLPDSIDKNIEESGPVPHSRGLSALQAGRGCEAAVSIGTSNHRQRGF